jgi:hypothetical protein
MLLETVFKFNSTLPNAREGRPGAPGRGEKTTSLRLWRADSPRGESGFENTFLVNGFGLHRAVALITLATVFLAALLPAAGQRIRIPETQPAGAYPASAAIPQAGQAPALQAPTTQLPTSPVQVSPPQMQLPPLTAPPTTIPGATFDAFGEGATGIPSTTYPPAVGSGAVIYPPQNASPWSGAPPGVGGVAPPGAADTVPGLYGPPPGTTYFGQQQPSGAWPSNSGAWPSQAWSRFQNEWWPRLIEHPRFRHTYLFGENGNDLAINDIELATSLTYPRFLMSQQPLRISPGFILHLWDGPDTAVTGVDLPSTAYSAYLAFDFISALSQPAGVEMNFTIGLYTDFNSVTSDSLRFTGVGLGWVRLNPTTTFKLGVEYIDRLDLKLFPAVGIFTMPTADLKMDFYFPRPRIAWRMPNNLFTELWMYVGAEYGGGSWTIERTSGMSDQVDINDIRVFVGLEGTGRRGGALFAEFGYVFERDLFYRSIGSPTSISDTFMVRSGFTF